MATHANDLDVFDLPVEIEQGMSVKVRSNGERFWLTYHGEKEGDQMVGTVDNMLVHEHPYKYGEKMYFKKENVIKTNATPEELELRRLMSEPVKSLVQTVREQFPDLTPQEALLMTIYHFEQGNLRFLTNKS